MKGYRLEVLTPRGKSFSGEVIHTQVPAEDGFVGVLAHHAPYVTSSPGGKLEIRLLSQESRLFRVGPGFFQIRENDAFFLTQSVQTESPV
jgi:F-type H+-transporting ATPase subunit epsilon